MATHIISSNFIISSPSYELCPPPLIPEYAFIGRSNVGKSSLINAICDKKEFARTSSKPGKTQLINYFEIESKDDEGDVQKWHLVDLPGYGYAKVARGVRRAWENVTEHYMIRRKNLAHVFVLIDSKLSPQKSDIDFVNGLYSFDIPFSLVLTKSDKVSQKDASLNLKAFMKELSKTMEVMPEHFITTVQKKGSTHGILNAIHEMNKHNS